MPTTFDMDTLDDGEKKSVKGAGASKESERGKSETTKEELDLSALYALSSELIGSLDKGELFRALINRILKLTGMTGYRAYLSNAKSRRLEPFLSGGAIGGKPVEEGEAVEIKGDIEDFLRSPDVKLIGNARDSYDYPQAFFRKLILGSAIILPLQGSNSVSGIILFFDINERRFGEDLRQFLSIAANNGGVALENALMHAEIVERIERAEIIQKYIALISKEQSLSSALTVILNDIKKLFSASKVCSLNCYDFDAAQTKMKGFVVSGKNNLIEEGDYKDIAPDALKKLLAAEKPIIWREGEGNFFKNPKTRLGKGVKSLIGFSYRFQGGGVWLFLACDGNPERVWSERESFLLSEGALHLSIAFQNIFRNEELTKKTAALTAANRELKALDEIKNNLLATLSHELRTPLVAIQGYTELMLKEELGPLTAEQRRGLQTSLRNIEMLIELMENIIYFAKRQSEIKPGVADWLDLSDLIGDVYTLMKPKLDDAKIVCSIEISQKPLLIYGEYHALQRLFINLLSNAIKFNKPAGKINISAKKQKDSVSVCVKDTGIGIDKAHHEKIFERFFQVAPPINRTRRGAGVGLAVVKEIVNMHGGDIRLESEPGKGSEFTVTLPCKPPHTEKGFFKKQKTV
ncbi:MAG: hypothetical protein Kow0090_09870 [Myxococcota bacterium]